MTAAQRLGAQPRRTDTAEEPSRRNEILKCADRVAASGVGWSVLLAHLRPPSPMPSPIQKVLCGSIDRDVPTKCVQTLLELCRLVEDLDDFELPAVVQFALAQEDLTLVGRFRTLRLIRVDKEDAPTRPQRPLNHVPEVREAIRRDMREPEAEEHDVIPLWRLPREQISLEIGDGAWSESPAIER